MKTIFWLPKSIVTIKTLVISYDYRQHKDNNQMDISLDQIITFYIQELRKETLSDETRKKYEEILDRYTNAVITRIED